MQYSEWARIYTRPKNNYSKFQTNFEKKYLLKFIFSKDGTMINPLIHGGKRSHTYLKKAATKS